MKYTIILGIGLNMFFIEYRDIWIPEIKLMRSS